MHGKTVKLFLRKSTPNPQCIEQIFSKQNKTMDIKIQNKIERYITLSKIFTKTELELFGEVKQSWGTLSLQANGYAICGQDSVACNTTFAIEGREVYIGSDNILKAKDNKPLSRAQEILLEAEIKAKLANDYDEYKALQKDLGEYFKINSKLTKE